MTEKQLLKDYPKLNHVSYKLPKLSILRLLNFDKYTDDRAFIVDYIDEASEKNGDDFFWEMTQCLKFEAPNPEHIAYTTPDKVISLFYPCTPQMVPQDANRFQRWYFIYCHECLHQLWDTFGVEDEIKNAYGSCNHDLLNIASDCVINDYLDKIDTDSKKRPLGGIFPDVLKRDYNIDYDRNVDTQLSLYDKLLKLSKDLQDKLKQQSGETPEGGSQGGQGGQGGGQGGQGGGQGGQSGSQGGQGAGEENKSPNENAKDAQKAADETKKIADKLSQEGSENVVEAQKAADEAQKAADDAKIAAKKCDKEGAAKAAKKAKEELSKAKSLSGNKNNNNNADQTQNGGHSGEGGEGNGGDGNGKGSGASSIYDREIKELEKEIKEKVSKIVGKYANSISGDLGNIFLEKCRASTKVKRPDFTVATKNASKGWGPKLQNICAKYLKQKIKSKKRYIQNRNKLKRHSKPLKYNELSAIQFGKKQIKEKFGFDINLYTDVSSSMSGQIKQVFKASYQIINDLKNTFGKSKNIDPAKINLKSFVFDTSMRKIDWGKTVNANGSTYDFHKLINDIIERGDSAFLNIIMTDGEFGQININETIEKLKKAEGMFAMVTCSNPSYFTELERIAKVKAPGKLHIIYTNRDFNT